MLKKMIELVKEKYKIDKKGTWSKWSISYFEWIKDETEEVFEEMRENNSVYLEDELGDILFAYLSLLENLEKEWKITSLENVIFRSEKKIWERVGAIKWIEWSFLASWDEVKKRQKEELKMEHEEKYGK